MEAAALSPGFDATITKSSGLFLPISDSELEIHADTGNVVGTESKAPRTLDMSFRLVRAPEFIRQPKPVPAEARHRVLQQWTGTVVDVSGSEFVAELRDDTDATRPDERVVIRLVEIDSADRPLVVPGAIFYWYIYDENRRGTSRSFWEIRMRRLPAWSKREITDVRTRAAKRAALFGID